MDLTVCELGEESELWYRGDKVGRLRSVNNSVTNDRLDYESDPGIRHSCPDVY